MPTAEIEQELAKIDDSRGNHVDANVYRSLAALAEAQDLLLSKRRLEPNSLWMSVPFNH